MIEYAVIFGSKPGITAINKFLTTELLKNLSL